MRTQRIEDHQCIAEGIANLLGGTRAAFHVMVTAAIDRIPVRDALDGEANQLRGQSERNFGIEDRGPTRDELFHQIVLRGPTQFSPGNSVFLRYNQIQREHKWCGRVNRHRRVDLVERNTIKQLLHVAPMAQRNACLTHLAGGNERVGIVAVLRRQVESNRKSPLSFSQVT